MRFSPQRPIRTGGIEIATISACKDEQLPALFDDASIFAEGPPARIVMLGG